jgi:DNA-binding response OmpR family regulator
MSQILIVEDERHLADGLRFNLEAESYQVRVVETGEAALDVVAADPKGYDLVVLDVMLPGKSGFEVVAEWRAAGQFVPTLILTARAHPDDVLTGFSAGADDYLSKPFDLAILLARIRGLLRRRQWLAAPQPQAPDTYTFADRTVDFQKLELRAGSQCVPLTLMEANVLRYLIQHEGQPVSRKRLLEDVWGLHEDTDTRAIDNFIVRLRRYVETDPTKPRHMLTVRGVGYRFVAVPTAS